MKDDIESILSQGVTKIILKDLKKQIEKDFGKKCKDKSKLCACCIVHEALETISELYEITTYKKNK